jgi:hypothetical protein
MRCISQSFWVSEQKSRRVLFEGCVDIICRNIGQDSGNKRAPGINVSGLLVNGLLSPEVQYACFHWTQHSRRAKIEDSDLERIRIVLGKHHLHWIEAL